LKPGVLTNQLKNGGFEGSQNWDYFGEISIVDDIKLGGAQSLFLKKKKTNPQPVYPVYRYSAAAQKFHLLGKKGLELIISAYAHFDDATTNAAGVYVSTTIYSEGSYDIHTMLFSKPDKSGWVFSTSKIRLKEDMRSITVRAECEECGSVHFDDVSLHFGISDRRNSDRRHLGYPEEWPISDRREYTEVTSESCEFHGFKTLTSTEECTSAALEVGRTIAWGGWSAYNTVVTGCSARFAKSSSHMFFNQPGVCDPTVDPDEWYFTGCKCTPSQPCLCLKGLI
jgi:hypothetical protein